VINGDITRVTESTKNLFVEVTGIDQKATDDILAVIAMTLSDAGFRIKTVSISSGSQSKRTTPFLPLKQLEVTPAYINSITGLDLAANEIIRCLRKCRLDAKKQNGGKISCAIPRYRSDLFSDIDVSEEVAVGYGIQRIDGL